MIDISGLEIKPIMEKALEGDIKKSQSDNSLARKLFEWKPEKKLEDWYQEKKPVLLWVETIWIVK